MQHYITYTQFNIFKNKQNVKNDLKVLIKEEGGGRK